MDAASSELSVVQRHHCHHCHHLCCLLPFSTGSPAATRKCNSRVRRFGTTSTSWYKFLRGRDGQASTSEVFVDGGHREQRAASRHARCCTGCVRLADDEIINKRCATLTNSMLATDPLLPMLSIAHCYCRCHRCSRVHCCVHASAPRSLGCA